MPKTNTVYKEIRILHLEDDEKDALIIKVTIQNEIKNSIIKRVSNQNDYELELKSGNYDIIISDFSLPSFNGIAALEIAQKLAPNVPYIYVSGHIGEDRAIEALKKGATDYVLKDKLIKLAPAINRVLKEIEEKNKNKEIQKELEETELKLKSIIDNFPISFFILNKDGEPTFSYGSWFDLIRMQNKKMSEANILKLIKNTNFELSDGNIITTGEAFLNVLTGKTQGGIISLGGKYFDTKLQPINNNLGEVTGIIGITFEISELIVTRNLLKEREELYRKIFESAPIGMARVSTTGIYLTCNKIFQKMLDYTENELQNKKIEDITYSDDIIKSKELFYNLISGRQDIVNSEKRYITKNGNILWVNLISSAIKNNEGNILYLITMVENINDKKLAEMALKESEIRFKELSSLLPLTVFEINLNHQITFVNNAGLNTFLYTMDDIRNGLSIIDIPISNDREFILDKFRQVIKGEQFGGVEFTAVRKDFSEFPCLAYANAIIKDNKPEGIRGILIDNTKIKNTLNELLEAKEKSEEMNKLKTNFLANMSHELRTPLIGILGYAEILKQELNEYENLHMVNTIYESGNRLLETVNLILNIAVIEKNNVQLEIIAFNVIEVVNQTILFFDKLAFEKGLFINIETPYSKLNVELDERMFRVILKNLIGNAIKFTKYGGVTIKLDLGKVMGNDILVVNVIDTGIGIKKENQNTIFEEFRQVSEGYSRNFEGSGLGLTVTKNFIEKMGGNIEVVSEIGKGTTFIITMPTKLLTDINNTIITDNSNYTAKQNVNISKGSGIILPDILLVDDDAVVADLIKRLLKNEYNLEWAKNGDEAIKLINNKNYSLILMDMNLQIGIDGLEVIKIIRSMNNFKSIPIIAVTAYAMRGDKEKFLNAGCTDYLSKPFEREELVNIIKETLAYS